MKILNTNYIFCQMHIILDINNNNNNNFFLKLVERIKILRYNKM